MTSDGAIHFADWPACPWCAVYANRLRKYDVGHVSGMDAKCKTGYAPRMATDYDDIAEQYVEQADRMAGNVLFERPATMALLPELDGLDILDAGCGAGFWTEYCVNVGGRVVAFDPSVRMAEHTARRVPDAEVHHCTTAELDQRLEGRQFDLILSCLVLHYVEDLDSEMVLLAERMKEGGLLIASMKHPFAYARSKPIQTNQFSYFDKALLDPKWGKMKVLQWTRPLGSITAAIERAKLVILKIREPWPHPAMKERNPQLFSAARRTPHLLQLVLWKPDRVLPLQGEWRKGPTDWTC